MSYPKDIPWKLRLRVGIFTFLGILLVIGVSVFVNNKPYWWRPCQLVYIDAKDATGLRWKSPVRSRGIQIGYLKEVYLFDTHVRLGICVTASVKILSKTHAYIRGEGLLGDKFVDLKPVRYVGNHPFKKKKNIRKKIKVKKHKPSSWSHHGISLWAKFLEYLIPSAWAEDQPPNVPVGEDQRNIQAVMEEVTSLSKEMKSLVKDVKKGIKGIQLQSTVKRLNHLLEDASRTLAPEGKLTRTAKRVLEKLEQAIERLRDQITRVNQGKGSVGMLLNDPKYADELYEALRSVNRLLSKVSALRFVVDVGGVTLPAWSGSRGWFQVEIWPEKMRYYLLGVTSDPRGKITKSTLTTIAGGSSVTVETIEVEPSALVFTAMLGKVFLKRLDLAIGLLHNDAAFRGQVYLGKDSAPTRVLIGADLYGRLRSDQAGSQSLLDMRVYGKGYLWSGLYLMGGVDSFRKVNGKISFFAGAGISFDDKDIKFLFSLL